MNTLTVIDKHIAHLDAGVLLDEDREFDPLRELFVAQSARPAHLGEINLRTLTPFQRSLMVIDGTVTKFIEAYTMEPVEIIRLGQEKRRLPTDHAWLEAPQGARVIARQVLLRGKYSYTIYAYAVSLVMPDRLQEITKQGLEIEGEGLGRMLLNNQTETYREILWYGKEQVNGLPDSIRRLTNNEFISRTYRIIADGCPIMLINEKFPSGGDRLPSHH
jgi:chorismate-pyruvate lyase